MLFKKGDIVRYNHHEFPWIAEAVKVTKSKAMYHTYHGKYRVKLARLSFINRKPPSEYHYMNQPVRIEWDKQIRMITPAPIKTVPKFKAKNGKRMTCQILKTLK